MASKNFRKQTEFKVEFWTATSGNDRKYRSRFYSTAEGMLRAGARWEAKGRDHWCRYWNGLNTWVSATRGKLGPPDPAVHTSKATIRPPGARAGRRTGSQVFSVFGICEATAAEMMLRDGRATLKIPVEQIPESALVNGFGHKALFAVMIPGPQVPAFHALCKELRA